MAEKLKSRFRWEPSPPSTPACCPSRNGELRFILDSGASCSESDRKRSFNNNTWEGKTWLQKQRFRLRGWARREAEKKIKAREAQGLPLIDMNYYEPSTIILPAEDE